MNELPSMPLLDYDADPRGYVEPSRQLRRATELPEHAVICFFDEAVRQAVGDRTPDHRLRWEHGIHGVWVTERDGRPLTICHPGCTAPLAAANLDALLASGCRKVIACGGAGTIAAGFDVGHAVIVTDAVRDEGTSYHYLPAEAGRTVASSVEASDALEAELRARGVPFEKGRTWTTDAIFRETRAKVARRRAEGCLTVEMEASALFAVAAFRGATIGQLLYCGDDLSSETWDHRGWDRATGVRQRLFETACAAVLRL